jgi:Fe-S cluster assembly iron-binding protein IscA
MLQLTHDAAVALGATIREHALPETAGVRVFGEPNGEGKIKLALAFADCPEEGDQICERDGARVFVAPEVAEPLAGSALDVRQGDNGTQLVITSAAS